MAEEFPPSAPVTSPVTPLEGFRHAAPALDARPSPTAVLAAAEEEAEDLALIGTNESEEDDADDDLLLDPPAAQVKSAGGPPIPNAEQLRESDTALLEEYEKACLSRGTKAASVIKYLGYSKRFLIYMREQGWTLQTMPNSAILDFCNAKIANPVSQNVAGQSVKGLLNTARISGMAIPDMPHPHNKVVRKNKQMPPSPLISSVPLPMPQDLLAAQQAQQQTQPQALFAAQAPPPQVIRIESAPAKSEPKPKTAPQPGRIRVSRRATGFEGPGVGPGMLIPIGTYAANDTGDQGVQEFLERFIHPASSARAQNGDVILYMVEHLNDRGLTTKSSEMPMMVMKADQPGQQQFAQQQPQWAPQQAQWGAPQQAQQPQQGSLLDKMIEMTMMREEKTRAEHDKLLTSLQQKPGGIDPMTIMMLTQKRDSDLDGLHRLLEEAKRQQVEQQRFGGGGAWPASGPQQPNFGYGGRPGAPGNLGGFDDLFGPAAPPAPPKPTPMEEAMAEVIKRSVQPPAVVAPPAVDPMIMFMKLIEVMKPTPPPPPVKDESQMMLMKLLMDQNAALQQQSREYMLKLANPSEQNSLGKSANEMGVLLTLMDKLQKRDPPQTPPSVTETVIAAFENAPQIGDMISKIVSARAMAATPAMAPRPAAQPAQPAQQPAPASQPRPHAQARQRTLPAAPAAPAPAAAPAEQNLRVPPKEVQEAVRRIVAAPSTPDGDQAIAENMMGILGTLGADPEWKPLLDIVSDQFARAASLPEIRALVTSFLIRGLGARRIVDQSTIDKVATVLHFNYSEIHKALFGTEKKLFDAAATMPQAPQPAPQAASAPAAPAVQPPVQPVAQTKPVVPPQIPAVAPPTATSVPAAEVMREVPQAATPAPAASATPAPVPNAPRELPQAPLAPAAAPLAPAAAPLTTLPPPYVISEPAHPSSNGAAMPESLFADGDQQVQQALVTAGVIQ